MPDPLESAGTEVWTCEAGGPKHGPATCECMVVAYEICIWCNGINANDLCKVGCANRKTHMEKRTKASEPVVHCTEVHRNSHRYFERWHGTWPTDFERFRYDGSDFETGQPRLSDSTSSSPKSRPTREHLCWKTSI